MEHNLLVRNILRVYLPITMLVSLTSTVATFINTFLTGIWLSDADVVSISVPSYLSLYISVTGSMVATGSSVIFLRYLAVGNCDKASNSYSIALYTAIGVGALFMAICFLYSYTITQGYDTPLSHYISAEYVMAMGISAIPLLMLQIAIMFLRMDGDKYLALACFFVYITVDIASVWYTVREGNGPFGVGISVGVGSAVALMLAPIHHRIKNHNLVLKKPAELLKGMKLISKIGFRSLLNRTSMTLRYYFLKVFIVTSSLCATSCLTAQNAVLHLVIAVFTGSAVMSAILCGMFYPQGDRKALCDAVWGLAAISLMISAIVAVAVLIFSEGITDLLVDDVEGRGSALWCLRWFAASIPTTTLCMILVYMYQSTKRKMLSNFLILFRGVALLALMVLALAPILGEAAVWTCFLLSDLCMLAFVVVMSWAHNRRFPRSLDDLMMLRGKKFESPSVFEGSIRNSRSELRELLAKMEKALNDGSVDEGTMKAALERTERVILGTIDRGYRDSDVHQIDVLVRKDDGLNIVIRDDCPTRMEALDGVRQAKALDLNIYYIDFKSSGGTA